jgi:XcyI restriction endonuclease
VNTPLPIFEPSRQVAFFLRLEQIRSLYLAEALSEAVRGADIAAVDAELQSLITPSSLSKVAAFGLRGEVIFPVPSLLRAKPMLLGYYRLLFGASQKFFYKGDTFGQFKAMEDRGVLNKTANLRLNELCLSLTRTGEMLVERLDTLSLTAIHELQLLTLGPQLKGGENNVVGEEAVKEFSDVLEALIKNSSGRVVFIKLGADPDVAITEMTQSGAIPLLAIEVKGGRDNANKHNRLGEAEKSHLTARQAGHTRFWTVVMVEYADKDVREKSPSTQQIWRLDKIRDPSTSEGKRFVDMLGSVLGVRDVMPKRR